MSDTVIKAENLSKLYRIGAKEGYKTFRETLIDSAKAPFLLCRDLAKKTIRPLRHAPGSMPSSQSDEYIWALKDVYLEVKQGEVLGIIGRNGAGKSTLLKILSKITEPTEGRVELRGRVGSLLEVGTGFHPELTGHENVYLYGAILGMDRWEVTRKFDEIIAFAELEKFVDTPVKRYSSGMYMRLAFAVAAHLEPEILLVDEVLAVGDAAFQKKCLGKMGDVSKEGRTVLFVSHNMAAVQNLCQIGLVLDGGMVFFNGDSNVAVQSYLSSMTDLKYGGAKLSQHAGRLPGMQPIIQSACIQSKAESGQRVDTITTGDNVVVEIKYDCGETTLDYAVVGFNSSMGERIFTVGTHLSPDFQETMVGKGALACCLPNFPLVEGEYSLTLAIGKKTPRHNLDCVEDALRFRVEAGDYFKTGANVLRGQGYLAQKSSWGVIALQDGGKSPGQLANRSHTPHSRL
jgi:lipopolysaccharide transport system ATP-binding protein